MLIYSFQKPGVKGALSKHVRVNHSSRVSSPVYDSTENSRQSSSEIGRDNQRKDSARMKFVA